MSSVASVLVFLFLHAFVNSNEILANYTDFVKKIINFDKVIAPLTGTPDGLMLVLNLLDASTKIPTGVLVGNFYDLGNYDECLAIEYDGQYGKYCLGTLTSSMIPSNYFQFLLPNVTRPKRQVTIHPELRSQASFEDTGVAFHFAACVLSNISASDIGFFHEYSEDFCYSKANETQLSAGTIGTIVLLAFVWTIICASTLYDIVLYYRKQETAHEVLLAFSLVTNSRKIFKSTKNPDQLLCLNGMRAFSMMWVIMGHDYAIMTSAPIVNILDVANSGQDVANMFLYGASVSVDTFFAIGGLVTVYTFMRTIRKGEQFNILLYYVHRYLRLTPALAIYILVYLYLLHYMGDGPLWKNFIDIGLVQLCQKGWWATLFYISNYVDDRICGVQTWYLAVDMQLFLLSPVVLLLLPKWPKIGLVLMGCLTVAGCLIPFCFTYLKKDLPYYQTYGRFGPYVIGMLAGYFIYKIKYDGYKFKLSAVRVVTLWLVLLTGLVACVYAGFPLNVATKPDIWGNSLFSAFNRPGWALIVCGMIFLCVTEHGGPIDAFLSLPIFQILTKLSYSMYLMHCAVISVRYARYRTSVYFSHYDVMQAYCGDFIWTLVFSFLLCVSFESPIITLEKWLFGGFHKSRPKAPKSQEGA